LRSDALDALKFALRVNPTKKPAVGSALLHASALKMHVVIDPESPEELHAGEFQVVAIASGEPFTRIDPSHFGFGLTVDPASGQESEIDRFRYARGGLGFRVLLNMAFRNILSSDIMSSFSK